MKLPDFEEIAVGMSLGELEYRLTLGRILQYREGTESNPVSSGDSSIAPPIICDNDSLLLPGFKTVIMGAGAESKSDERPMFMNTKVEFDFLGNARAGDLIKVRGKVADKYEKKGRQWVVVETLSSNENGPVLLGHTTYSWLSPVKTEK